MNGITMLISQAAMGEEAHAKKTAVASMEQRADENGTPDLWAVEKRADENGTPDLWSVEKRADENGTPDLWAVEKRVSAGAKTYQAKRANYPTPQPWRPDA